MNATRTIYLFVNGIATWPGNFTNWNKRAVTYTHTHTDFRAEAFEYFCTPISRPFREDQREKHFARSLQEYSKLGWDIICVGHSNGAAVILKGLEDAGWPRVRAIHLVCGACESDFWQNGLNTALDREVVGDVFIYVAEQDWALRLAHTIPGKLLGYGTLGLHGARNVYRRVASRVHTIWWTPWGHSDCWLPHNFFRTMEHFFTAQAAWLNPVVNILTNAHVMEAVGIRQGETWYALRVLSTRPGTRSRHVGVYQLSNRIVAEKFLERNGTATAGEAPAGPVGEAPTGTCGAHALPQSDAEIADKNNLL